MSVTDSKKKIELPNQAARNHSDFGEARAVARLAAPIAAVGLINMAMGITDAFMAASFGSSAFAAVAIGSDFFSIVFYVVIGLAGGMAPLFAHAAGRNDHEQMRRVRTTAWAVLSAAVAVGVPVVWFAPSYLSLAGIAPELLAEGTVYTKTMALTMVPMGIVSVFRNRFASLERSGIVLKITLTAVPLNAAANYVFMFGLGPIPGFGVNGAGYASLTVATFSAVALALGAHRIGDRGLSPNVDLGLVRQVIRIRAPLAVSTLAEVGMFLGSTIVVAAVSARETAAHTIVLRLAGVAYVLPYGLSQAAMVRMSRSEGREAGMANRRRVIFGALSAAGLCSGGLVITLILASFVLPPFLLEQGAMSFELTQTAAALLLILAVIEGVESLGMTSAGLMRGRGDTRSTMYFSILGNWGVAIPVVLILSVVMDLGATGVWIGIGVGNIAAQALTLLRVRRHWTD